MWKAGWLVLVLAGCGPATVADGCFELADVICTKLDSCGALNGETVGECRSEGTASCCRSVDDCSRPPKPAGVENVRRCQAEIRAMTCGQVAGGLIPAACGSK